MTINPLDKKKNKTMMRGDLNLPSYCNFKSDESAYTCGSIYDLVKGYNDHTIMMYTTNVLTVVNIGLFVKRTWDLFSEDKQLNASRWSKLINAASWTVTVSAFVISPIITLYPGGSAAIPAVILGYLAYGDTARQYITTAIQIYFVAQLLLQFVNGIMFEYRLYKTHGKFWTFVRGAVRTTVHSGLTHFLLYKYVSTSPSTDRFRLYFAMNILMTLDNYRSAYKYFSPVVAENFKMVDLERRSGTPLIRFFFSMEDKVKIVNLNTSSQSCPPYSVVQFLLTLRKIMGDSGFPVKASDIALFVDCVNARLNTGKIAREGTIYVANAISLNKADGDNLVRDLREVRDTVSKAAENLVVTTQGLFYSLKNTISSYIMHNTYMVVEHLGEKHVISTASNYYIDGKGATSNYRIGIWAVHCRPLAYKDAENAPINVLSLFNECTVKQDKNEMLRFTYAGVHRVFKEIFLLSGSAKLTSIDTNNGWKINNTSLIRRNGDATFEDIKYKYTTVFQVQMTIHRNIHEQEGWIDSIKMEMVSAIRIWLELNPFISSYDLDPKQDAVLTYRILESICRVNVAKSNRYKDMAILDLFVNRAIDDAAQENEENINVYVR